MLRRHFTLLVTVGAATMHLAVSAQAQQTFAGRSQVIKAGVVLLESSSVVTTQIRNGVPTVVNEPVSAAPHVWFNLDSNKTVKPAGWTFVNPHPKTVMDASERSRWVGIQGVIPPRPAAYDAPAGPARYSKRHAAYWEARLSQLSEAQIADYDVLLVAPVNGVRITPAEREKLRRFVDKGGILWIDPSALPTTGIDLANSFPTPTRLATAANEPELRDFSQPLLSSPQPLSLRDMSILSSMPGGETVLNLVAPTGTGTPLLFGESFSDFFRIKPVVGAVVDGNNRRFSVGVSRIGDGFVVLTSRAAAMKLNRVRVAENPQDYSYRTNLAFAARDANLQPDGIAAAKFAINMISLGREYGHPQGGSQKSGSSPIDIGAPLIKRSEDLAMTGATNQPVFYKGLMIVTAGGVVRVYDADPARDIDGNGNTDDGAPDTGTDSYDLVWQSQTLPGLSSAVCVEVPNSEILRPDGTVVRDQLLVTDEAGTLHAFDLMRYNAAGTIFIDPIGPSTRPERREMSAGSGYAGVEYPISAPAASGAFQQPPADEEPLHPPTVHENMAYMTDRTTANGGRLWMVNLVTGTVPVGASGPWFMGGASSALPAYSASPTIGFIPILDNSGGVDRVLYAPIARNTNPPGQPAGFSSIWLGAKGEKPAEYELLGTTLTVTTRAGREGLPIFLPAGPSPYGVRLSLVYEDGSAVSQATMEQYFSNTITQPSPGQLQFTLANGNTALPPNVAGVRVDYSIDFSGGGGNLVNAKRGDIQLPDSTTPNRRIVGNLALTPRGTLYMTTSGNGRGALYGFREEGRGSFKCVMRYELYTQHSMSGQGLPDQRVPALFEDIDDVRKFAFPFLGQAFSGFDFRSGPVVRGDAVYAIAAAPKGPVNTGLVMAFKAEPETTAIYLDNFPANGSIVQPDLARSVVTQRPEISPAFQVGQVPGITYDAELKQLRIENLATTTKGQLQAVLNLSQPIIVRSPGGGGDRLIYPNGNNAANRFDPLLWFTVINGYTPGSSALVATGSTLFLGGSSQIRSMMNGEAFPWRNEGLMMAFDTEGDTAGSWFDPSPSRPWMRQLVHMRVTDALEVTATTPFQLWPLFQGVSDRADLIARINQATVPGDRINSIAAGEGVLAAVGSGGLFSYSKADFYVADQGRIASFDPAGNPTFELTTTGNSGDVENGSTGAGRPVVNPTRAYPLPNNEILVADPGANRIFRVNRNGTETRAISKFQLDQTQVAAGRAPANYPANGSLNLNAPRDVVTYTSVKSQAEVQAYVTSTGAAYEYWTHYLIADTGNRRLVEVVDRYAYDPVNRRILDAVQLNGKPQLGVLIWHSPPATNGKGYEYNSISRVWLNDRYVYFAGIGGSLPTVTDTGTRPPVGDSLRETAGFGGIAVFDSSLPEGVTVINRLAIPAISANVFWNDATAAFDSAARPATEKQLVNVNSVTARTISVGLPSSPTPVYQVAVMVTDASGVYEFAYTPPAAASEVVPQVQWMLPNDIYRAMRRDAGGPLRTSPHQLRAVYARRVESGEVLVVNGYFGQTRGDRNANGTFSNRTPFRGEVIQVDGRISDALWTAPNMNFGNLSITLRLELNKNLSQGGTRDLVLPVFADRR